MNFATRAYYGIKPLVPRPLRAVLRRQHARRMLRRSTGKWPIDLASGQPRGYWNGWPEGKKFAVVLTHDVEGQAGYDRIPNLVSLEKEMGFRSSFNLIPEGPYRVAPELRAQLTEDAFEVGVHDLNHDGRLYQSRESFLRRAQRINRYIRDWKVVGFRSAYMQHNLGWIQDLDVEYDASTFDTDPFEPQPDGVGTIFPFWIEGSHGRPGYVELPYTLVQDSTLMLFLEEKTIDIWKEKVDWIAEQGGMVLVNVHPDYVSFNGRQTATDFPSARYRELLEYLSDRYAGEYWHALPRELSSWYAAEIETSQALEVVAPSASQFATDLARYPSLAGKRAAVILYSEYPGDPRPRRAAQALADQGMQVDVLCLKSDPGDPKFEVINGVSVYREGLIHNREGGILRYVIQYSSFLARSALFLAKRSVALRYDLVHVHNMPDFLVFSTFFARLRGSKVILDLHDPMPELFQAIYQLPEKHWMINLLKEIERLSIRATDRSLTPNLAFQQIFESRSCEAGKMGIVMNSPEETVFQPDVEPAELPAGDVENERPFRVLHHGSVVHRHGLDILVEAVAIASRTLPSIQLFFCGRSNAYLQEVMARAAELGIADKVIHLGSMPQAEIARVIAACDVGVIPNRLSPFTAVNMPTRIFEYLAMDRPVICPDTRGIRDYFDDGNMLFFEPGSPDALAKQILWTQQNKSATEELIRHGQVIYRQQVWERQREQFLNLVEELLAH